jgi:hypothetical protein
MSEPIGDAKSTPATVRKAECSRCGGIRKCDIHAEHTESYISDPFQAWTDRRILECRGCGYVFMQTVSTNNSEDYDYDDEGSPCLKEDVKYWPALSKRKMPDWMEKGLEAKDTERLSFSMLELYGALDNDLNSLAGIGIRMSFDIAAKLLGVEPEQPFENKLNELVSKGLIGVVDKDRLEILVDAGSASVHRGWHPKYGDLSSMMDILEHFVEAAFVEPLRRKRLDDKAAIVKTSVPPRKHRAKKADAKP